MNSKAIAALGALIVAAALSASASAAVLYDNGPANGAIAGRTINFGQSLADSFTLARAATIESIDFTSWDFPGQPASTLQSVGYAIETTPSLTVATQTASTTSSYEFTNPNGYLIDNNEFATSPTSLAAGTYYLLLADAVTVTGSEAFWDENDGPSTGYGPYNSTLGSETFQVNGVYSGAVSSAPEPSAWLLMLAGVGGAGLMLRSTRRSATSQSVAITGV